MDEKLFEPTGESLKRCRSCRGWKPRSEFHRDRSRRDGLQGNCKACNVEIAKRFYAENPEHCKERDKKRKPAARELNRRRILEYLLNHSCVDCGERDPVVLEFDHLRDKREALSSYAAGARSWATILKEIEKCEVRCANCHRRKTAREMNNFKWRMTRITLDD